MKTEKEKIFIVDDEKDILEILDISLKKFYDVYTSYDPYEAIEKFKKYKFPVVILDIILPKLNGIELLKIFKKELENISAIMLTAYSTIDTAVASLNEGAFAYLVKPVNVDGLLKVIKNAYDKYYFTQQENYINIIINNLSIPIMLLDENKNIKKINKVMEEFLGYKNEELFDEHLDEILSKNYNKENLKKFLSKEIEQVVSGLKIDFKTKDGKIKEKEFILKPVKEKNNMYFLFISK